MWVIFINSKGYLGTGFYKIIVAIVKLHRFMIETCEWKLNVIGENITDAKYNNKKIPPKLPLLTEVLNVFLILFAIKQ